jgi:hypothetical protein
LLSNFYYPFAYFYFFKLFIQINSLNNSSDNQSIFGRDIFNNVLNPSLGEENTTLGITSSDGAFSDPFNSELKSLSLIEQLIISEKESQNSSFNSNPTFDFNTPI